MAHSTHLAQRKEQEKLSTITTTKDDTDEILIGIYH